MNLNGKTDDRIFDTSSQAISILQSKSVVLSTSIEKEGEISLPYDPENKDTILNLYSKDSFSYNINIKNNTDGVKDYILYLPIPKSGYNFGSKFQDEAFTWNMKLTRKPKLPDGYKVLYAINKTKSKSISYDDLTYVSDIKDEDLKDVIMIKIISNKKLLKGEKQKLNISLSSSESRASSIEKLGSINIWNPLSILNTTSISGEFKGNKVATKLLFPELSGRIFLDNNLNGIYDEDIDKIVSASKIELYKLKDDNLYELISLDGDILIDNKTGQYYINDSKYLNEGIYALKFTLPDEYNILENNVIDKSGWIKNINVNGMPINNLNVPLLKYDLDFNIIKEEIVAKDESILVSINNISPNYFDIIKDDIKAYSWKVNENYTDYVEIEDNNDSKTVLKGLKEVNKALIDVTISDKYGKKLTKNFYVTVKEDTKPVIEASDVSLFVNDRFEYEKYIKEAYDYKNNKIVLDFGINGNATYQTDAVIENGIVTKEGTYKIKYTVSDRYGNYGYKEINLYVKKKTINDVINDSINTITNPKTYDNIFTYVYILIGSALTITLIIFNFIKQKEQD